ncbi:MAG: SGNH/GDSL hydrolase family protein [bacterium]
MYIIDTQNSLGIDHEATVDGIHFTDLGFMRFADFLIDNFAQLKLINTGLKKKKLRY